MGITLPVVSILENSNIRK